MKKLATISFVFFTSLIFSDEIDDIIAKINSKRDTIIPQEVIVKTLSPIVDTKSAKSSSTEDPNGTPAIKSSKKVLKLKAIINSRAKINNKWLSIGDRIEGYKIVDIMDNSVYLRDGNRSRIIFFDKSKHIKIFTR